MYKFLLILIFSSQFLLGQVTLMNDNTKEILQFHKDKILYRAPDQSIINLNILNPFTNFEKGGYLNKYITNVTFPNQPKQIYELKQENMFTQGYNVVCTNPDGTKQEFWPVYLKDSESLDYKLIQDARIIGCWAKSDTIIEISSDLSVKMLFPSENKGKLIWKNRIQNEALLQFENTNSSFYKDWTHLVDFRNEAFPFLEFCNARLSHNFTTLEMGFNNIDTFFTDFKTGEQIYFHYDYPDQYLFNPKKSQFQVFYKANSSSKPIEMQIISNKAYYLEVKFYNSPEKYIINYKLSQNPNNQAYEFILTNPDGKIQKYKRK